MHSLNTPTARDSHQSQTVSVLVETPYSPSEERSVAGCACERARCGVAQHGFLRGVARGPAEPRCAVLDRQIRFVAPPRSALIFSRCVPDRRCARLSSHTQESTPASWRNATSDSNTLRRYSHAIPQYRRSASGPTPNALIETRSHLSLSIYPRYPEGLACARAARATAHTARPRGHTLTTVEASSRSGTLRHTTAGRS